MADAPPKAAHGTFVDIDSAGGWLFVALLGLHIATALKHQWVDGHPELRRMGLGR